jgi:Ca2+-binding RTX toxin-like protein
METFTNGAVLTGSTHTNWVGVDMVTLVDDVLAFSFAVTKGSAEESPVRLSFSTTLSQSFDHLQSISFLFWPVGGDQTWATATRVPGTDRFEATIDLSPYARSGSYEVRVFQLHDAAGNQVDVTSAQLSNIGFEPFSSLSNTYSDSTPPTLDDIQVFAPVANDDGTFSVRVRVAASDDRSGLQQAGIVEFTSPGGKSIQQWGYFSDEGVAEFSFVLPATSASGFYKINTVRLYDEAQNATLNYDPAAHGDVAGFELLNPNGDTVAPTLEAIDVTGSFDPVTGRPTLRYEIQWADDKSGVADSYLRVYLPNGGQNDRWLTIKDGRSVGTISLLSPSAGGVYRLAPFATDAAGNRSTWFSADDLDAMGFSGSLNVFSPDESAYGQAPAGRFALYALGANEVVGATVRSGDQNSIVFGLHKNDILFGGAGRDELLGGAGDDQISGGGSSDHLDGGAGADTMTGGAGNDTYVVDNDADRVFEAVSGGMDTVQSSISFVLGSDTEILVLTGTGAINGTGNALVNNLTGNGAANVLNGGAGADWMTGGAGNDTYVVENAGDRVFELAGGGSDTVQSALSYTLGSEVENLTLTGAGTTNATGNLLANILTGNGAANVLNGGAGADTMSGGLGNDIYHVDNLGDRVLEASASGGIDLVASSVSISVAAQYVENITLTGTAAINATGNGLANALVGNVAANVLNGGVGADEMTGGAGNDTYVVDNVGDRVTELAGGGLDTVQSSVSFVLGNQIEILVLTGTGTVNGTGNALVNNLTGNGAANVLNGGAGADWMTGGAGNDMYVVDNAGDRIFELFGGGTDTVQSAVTVLLGAELENATLTGAAAVNATGNALANTLVGNGAANVLDGKAGADTMNGSAGNDTYLVDNAGDRVFEAAGGGTDTVISSVTFYLSNSYEVENVTLAGSTAISAHGNSFANSFTGNNANNILNGYAGNDRLVGNGGNDSLAGGDGADLLAGGLGNDVLDGGVGADRFQFDTALSASANVDRIAGFSAADDTIALSRAVFTAFAATGMIAASAFVVGTAAADAADRIVYDQASGRIFYDADGSDAGAAILFAQVAAGTVLTSADFQVF